MRWSTRFPAALAAATLALGACADPPTTPSDPVAKKDASPSRGDERRDFHAALNEMLRELRKGGGFSERSVGKGVTVRHVGRGELLAARPTDPPEPVLEPGAPGPEAPDAFGEERIRAFNSRTRQEFEVTLAPELLDAVHRWQESRGQTSATEGVDDPGRVEGVPRTAPAAAPLLSTGPSFVIAGSADSRNALAPNVWPWRAIAQFNYGGDESGCTGTFVGPRHVITAAHCVNQYKTNTWYMFTVTPARNGTGAGPFGSSSVSTSPAPGTEVWYFTPSGWRDPNVTCNTACDWAMIVIPDRLGDQTGWMGYVARPAADLQAVSHFNRGYPLCDDDSPSVPEDCEIARLYGDANACAVGDFGSKASNGWNLTYKHNCDTSPGHSGSSLYHYYFDPAIGRAVPVVSMVHKGGSPDPGGSAARPNYGRRLDPGALGVISSLRTTFP